ncbi:hypothetical protein PP583_gp24 [Pseudoalteromonas phage HS6]|uniref:hypothetical protein n=1 Tax=Pseudoalteromonas phage HS6 TaxID=1357710 RepID=UPI002329701E|nr:hypothetical protein PP583_gp24 [Pseudoalteromonas phage HS6]
MRPALTNALTNAIREALNYKFSSGDSLPSWYNKTTGLVYPGVLITDFNEVIQWQN